MTKKDILSTSKDAVYQLRNIVEKIQNDYQTSDAYNIVDRLSEAEDNLNEAITQLDLLKHLLKQLQER